MSRKESEKTKQNNRKPCYLVVDDTSGMIIDLYTVTDRSKQKLNDLATKGELYLLYQKGRLIQTLMDYSKYIRELERKRKVKVEAVISLSLFRMIKDEDALPYCI